jgi:hypothetical protein
MKLLAAQRASPQSAAHAKTPSAPNKPNTTPPTNPSQTHNHHEPKNQIHDRVVRKPVRNAPRMRISELRARRRQKAELAVRYHNPEPIRDQTVDHQKRSDRMHKYRNTKKLPPTQLVKLQRKQSQRKSQRRKHRPTKPQSSAQHAMVRPLPQPRPPLGLFQILRNSDTLLIHVHELPLRVSISLVRRRLIPTHRLQIILRHAFPEVVHQPNPVFRLHVALIRRHP